LSPGEIQSQGSGQPHQAFKAKEYQSGNSGFLPFHGFDLFDDGFVQGSWIHYELPPFFYGFIHLGSWKKEHLIRPDYAGFDSASAIAGVSSYFCEIRGTSIGTRRR